MGDRVLFYVQHLLGVGHVKRAAAICSGLTDAGLEVTVAFGGMPVENVSFGDARVVQLPATRSSDAAFSSLVDERGAALTEAWWEGRLELLLRTFDALRPTVLLVEHFPFGRRKFRRELIPLFEAARATAGCRIVGSVRDILVTPGEPAKRDKIIALARSWFDTILVHGDPDVIRLEDTFPAVDAIAGLLRYTGYVVDTPAAADAGDGSGEADGHGEVIVSAGGGAVGAHLFRVAHAACAGGCLADRTWRFLAGGNFDPAVTEELTGQRVANAVIEPARPDFSLLLHRAALSISQAGYNTMMDLLVADCPAIVVPFATGGETEQTFRAEKFAAAGLMAHLPEAELTVAGLAATAEAWVNCRPANRQQRMPIRLDGVTQTGQLVAELARSDG